VIKVHHHQAIQRQTRGRKTQGKDRWCIDDDYCVCYCCIFM
jgi:hypothetical protein